MNRSHHFDVIVVGGGHAGIEAAWAAATLGSKTLLITLDVTKIGYMPCNPALGGVGKGHIVYEVSALGGLMPQLATHTYLQARMLNTKKGPAVQGLRLQIDKHAYNALAHKTVTNKKNLTVVDGTVEDVLVKNGRVHGLVCADGTTYYAPTVVLTTGTFLNGVIHIGLEQKSGGRHGEKSVSGLAKFLLNLKLNMGRLKTGTPPRLDKNTIDVTKMERQDSDELNHLFEFAPHKTQGTHPCYITHTNARTHDIIAQNLDTSPMYCGNITGVGPRYCPSIEDKVGRFADKQSHHIFVEPESLSSNEVYPNGISTSLPAHVQEQFVHSIVGFESAKIVRPGYAIEYDFILPNQLRHTMELKTIDGLFLAGQINGTTGYEEAAGQGLVAGINASQKVRGEQPCVLDRTNSYIGVMIDDLVTLSVDEPYRMFTSRAERRLLLRQDNVFARLSPLAHQLGMINDQLFAAIEKENELVVQTLATLRATMQPSALIHLFEDSVAASQKINELARQRLSDRAVQTIHAEVRYAPYLAREQRQVERAKQYQQLLLPSTLDYATMDGLSMELREKLQKHKPHTIAQASLIPGMTPAALSLLIFKTKQG